MTKLARTMAIATMGVVCAAYVAAQTNAYVSSGAPQTVIDTRANVLRAVQLGYFSPDGTKAYGRIARFLMKRHAGSAATAGL